MQQRAEASDWSKQKKRKCELEDRPLETIQSKENKLKRMKASEESLHELQDTIKRNNLRIIEDPKVEEREMDRKVI